MGILEISADENAMLDELKKISELKAVESIGRKDKPPVMLYPSAFVYWFRDILTQSKPRPVNDRRFHVLVYYRNLRNEDSAADGVYTLIESIYSALVGLKLDQALESLNCTNIGLFDYDAGVISYLLEFSAKRYISRRTGL